MAAEELDRRRYPRIPSRYDVNVRLAEENRAIPAVSTVGDVGHGGCRFVSRENWPVGSILWLTILPKKSIVEAKARVVYEKQQKDGTFEIGAEFMEISPRNKTRLADVLKAEAQPVS
jgi:c-di-GMP-binding flagellar brake protein YcgR